MDVELVMQGSKRKILRGGRYIGYTEPQLIDLFLPPQIPYLNFFQFPLYSWIRFINLIAMFICEGRRFLFTTSPLTSRNK